MLIGNRWSELAISHSQSDNDANLAAAIHKSPDQLMPCKARVFIDHGRALRPRSE
jgi:hypothetical protein